MNNCVVKALKVTTNLTNLPKKFCEFPPWALKSCAQNVNEIDSRQQGFTTYIGPEETWAQSYKSFRRLFRRLTQLS